MSAEAVSAARRYKEISAGMTEAVERMRAQDREKAVELSRRLVDLDEAMGAAADREALTVLTVALMWESALEALWNEQWMTLRPLPQPDARATPAELDYLDAVAEQRYAALREAVRSRRSWPGRRR